MGIHNLFAPVAIIGMAHVLGGVAVLAAHDADKVSGLSGPMLANTSPYIVASSLLFVGGLALASRVRCWKEPYRTICAIPQQFFLMLQLMGVIIAIVMGAVPRWFHSGSTQLLGKRMVYSWRSSCPDSDLHIAYRRSDVPANKPGFIPGIDKRKERPHGCREESAHHAGYGFLAGS